VKVAEFQKFLVSMGEVMASSGAAGVGKELKELSAALDHYKDKTLLGLRDVLNKARQEKATGGGRRPSAAGPDEAKIQSALGKLQQLLARALDPALKREAVEAAVKPLANDLTAPELTEVAKRFGLPQKQSKPKTVEAIINRIAGQKGAYARAQE
jgi:hypothetical protein